MLDLTLAHVNTARTVIPAVFLDSPQYEDELLNAALKCRVTVKLETANPLRSFKGRGVSLALRDVAAGHTVVCSSSGNFGQAVAFVGRARGARVRVFAPTPLNPVKRERMVAFGADVVEVAGGSEQARRAAAAAGVSDNAVLLVDGVDPALAEGAATIAQELTSAADFDTIVAPLGDGSLISGLALWTRTHAPATRIIGVNPASAPAMHDSWHAGTPLRVNARTNFAEGITISRPHTKALHRITHLVDDIVLVTDEDLQQAMALAATHLSIVAEPAGAAGIAAIAAGRVGGGRIATIITGANPHPRVVTQINSADPKGARQ